MPNSEAHGRHESEQREKPGRLRHLTSGKNGMLSQESIQTPEQTDDCGLGGTVAFGSKSCFNTSGKLTPLQASTYCILGSNSATFSRVPIRN